MSFLVIGSVICGEAIIARKKKSRWNTDGTYHSSTDTPALQHTESYHPAVVIPGMSVVLADAGAS